MPSGKIKWITKRKQNKKKNSQVSRLHSILFWVGNMSRFDTMLHFFRDFTMLVILRGSSFLSVIPIFLVNPCYSSRGIRTAVAIRDSGLYHLPEYESLQKQEDTVPHISFWTQHSFMPTTSANLQTKVPNLCFYRINHSCPRKT